jgi:hypothetical protein
LPIFSTTWAAKRSTKRHFLPKMAKITENSDHKMYLCTAECLKTRFEDHTSDSTSFELPEGGGGTTSNSPE